MENAQNEKSERDVKKELGAVKETLELCSRNMIKVGSPRKILLIYKNNNNETIIFIYIFIV